MGGGSQSSSSNSRPLTGSERMSIYQSGLASIGTDKLPKGNGSFKIPDAKTLSGGDYDRLEKSIVASRTAPLDSLMERERERVDASLAKRGVWSSPIAEKAQQDVTKSFAPQYAAAGSDAAAQRYNTQLGELWNLNAFNANKAGTENNSQWKMAEYLQGLWNGTGGAISSGSGSGWNFNI